MKQEIIDKINRLASQDEPFLFVINYQGDKAFIRLLSDINGSPVKVCGLGIDLH